MVFVGCQINNIEEEKAGQIDARMHEHLRCHWQCISEPRGYTERERKGDPHGLTHFTLYVLR